MPLRSCAQQRGGLTPAILGGLSVLQDSGRAGLFVLRDYQRACYKGAHHRLMVHV